MRSLFTTTACVLAFALPMGALAENIPFRNISVTGEGAVTMAPDLATVYLGVVVEADETGPAMDEASVRTAAVLARLAELGVAEADIRTGAIRLAPRYAISVLAATDLSRIAGYTAQNEIVVKVRDLNTLGLLLSSVVGEGANSFNGVEFGLADPVAAMDEARRAAVADAMRRAALFADAAGEDLGPLVSLSENGWSNAPLYRMQAEVMEGSFGSGPAMNVPVAPGEVQVTASVNMVFGLAD